MKRLLIGLSAIAAFTAVPLLHNTPAQANFLKAGSNLVKKLTQPEVKLNLAAYKKEVEHDQIGQTKVVWKDLGSQAVVQPGDVLRYSITSRNIGDAAARNLVLNQPVPAQMSYVPNSAASNAGLLLSYSIDGGKHFSVRPMIQVKQADGNLIETPAPAELYTHLRWEAQGDLPPQRNIVASYEVRVR